METLETAAPAAPLAYTAPDAGAEVQSRVASTVCLLAPHLLLTAGYDADGTVLAVRYAHHDSDLPPWNAEAFENALLNEPLLADPAQLAGVFFADDRLLAVPDALYEPDAAAGWLRKLQYVAPNETVLASAVAKKSLHVLAPFSSELREVAQSYFGTLQLLPLSCALLQAEGGTGMTIALAGGLATVALHRGSRLLWHGAARYDTPEDVAYRMHTACREHGILTKTVAVTGTAATLTEAGILRDLLAYFPAAAAQLPPAPPSDWAPVTALMRRLHECVL